MSRRVREATADDAVRIAPIVAALKAELGSEDAPQVDRIAAACVTGIERGVYGGLVLEDDGEIIGYAGYNPRFTLYAFGEFMQLTEFFVHPDRRGQGIGTTLIWAIELMCREKGWERIEVNMPKTDLDGFDDTDAFYRNKGYVSRHLRTNKVIRPVQR